MIKALHKLHSKKGFTLVELIVVIAIIGVLAAILIPTMLGMVVKTRVTSANSTAASAQKTVAGFFLQAEISGYGMNKGSFDVFDMWVFEDDDDGVTWECTAADPTHFASKHNSHITWGSGGHYVSGEAISGITSGETLLCAALAGAFPEIDSAAFVIAVKNGACTFLAYTNEQSSALGTNEYPAITNGTPATTFEWNGKTAGISPTGKIIGTAPAILMS